MTGDETEATWTVDGRRDKMRWRVATKEMPPSLISWDRVNEIGRDCACIRSIHGTRAVFPGTCVSRYCQCGRVKEMGRDCACISYMERGLPMGNGRGEVGIQSPGLHCTPPPLSRYIQVYTACGIISRSMPYLPSRRHLG